MGYVIVGFICLCVGSFIGLVITSLIVANRNMEEYRVNEQSEAANESK